MTDMKVYNVVTYDGVDSYVIKAIGRNEQDAKDVFKNTDMEVLKVEEQYTWEDIEEHIKGAMRGDYELGAGNIDLRLALLRYFELKTGLFLQ